MKKNQEWRTDGGKLFQTDGPVWGNGLYDTIYTEYDTIYTEYDTIYTEYDTIYTERHCAAGG